MSITVQNLLVFLFDGNLIFLTIKICKIYNITLHKLAMIWVFRSLHIWLDIIIKC